MTDAQGSVWYLKAGFTMFTMCNDKLWLTVQPAVKNLGICERDDKGSPSVEHVEISTEDAEAIMSLIKEAIQEASAGKGLDLNPAMERASSLA